MTEVIAARTIIDIIILVWATLATLIAGTVTVPLTRAPCAREGEHSHNISGRSKP